MSTDSVDARIFGNLEARVNALEVRAGLIDHRIESNHTETMTELREMRTILDRQGGGILVLRWIGAGLVAASGWATWALKAWPRAGH